MPARCNRGFYCRSYCLLSMFRAPLCPSSGAQDYYTVVAVCGNSCCRFQVVGLVWSWGLCVRFAGLFKDACSYYVENEFLNKERVVKISDCCSLQKHRDVGKLKRSEIPCIIGYTLTSVNSRNWGLRSLVSRSLLRFLVRRNCKYIWTTVTAVHTT